MPVAKGKQVKTLESMVRAELARTRGDVDVSDAEALSDRLTDAETWWDSRSRRVASERERASEDG